MLENMMENMMEKKYVEKIINDKNELDNFYKYWSLTFEGVEKSDGNIEYLINWLEENDAIYDGKKVELNWISGDLMNKKYDLKYGKKYPEDLSILVIENIKKDKIAIPRLNLGGRWFYDVVEVNKLCY